jgi:hypothetical protein
MPVANAVVNMGVDSINNLVESGALLWVFNLATDPCGKISSLRFFLPELEARASGDSKRFSDFQIAQIVGQILPASRSTWQAGALDQHFQLSRPARISLHAEILGNGGIRCQNASSNIYARDRLAKFLERRWLGNLGTETHRHRQNRQSRQSIRLKLKANEDYAAA